jgi:hypothetical protein
MWHAPAHAGASTAAASAQTDTDRLTSPATGRWGHELWRCP